MRKSSNTLCVLQEIQVNHTSGIFLNFNGPEISQWNVCMYVCIVQCMNPTVGIIKLAKK